jgi:hypothetical protein
LILIQIGKDWSFAMAIKLRDDFDARMLRVDAMAKNYAIIAIMRPIFFSAPLHL